MGWTLARRRLTGWLALAALALQLAVSFGHVHAEDFAALGAGVAQAGAATPDEHPGTDHANCDICAVVHLAGTLLVPVPPALAVPAAFVAATLDATTPHARAAAHTAAFHARGPPQA